MVCGLILVLPASRLLIHKSRTENAYARQKKCPKIPWCGNPSPTAEMQCVATEPSTPDRVRTRSLSTIECDDAIVAGAAESNVYGGFRGTQPTLRGYSRFLGRPQLRGFGDYPTTHVIESARKQGTIRSFREMRWGGRAVEGTGLENRRGASRHRGFESHPHRFPDLLDPAMKRGRQPKIPKPTRTISLGGCI